MKVIQPNCRLQFTEEDIQFIIQILACSEEKTRAAICSLLSDQDSRDSLLDEEKLYNAVLESPGCLRVSTYFYFYVLVRQVLRRSGIMDRRLADYVAVVLAEFSRAERMQWRSGGSGRGSEYFFELVEALQKADDRTAFQLRVHIGNYSLFLSGVFPQRLQYRTEFKGAPDLGYYEKLGQVNYRVASDHRLAQHYELDRVLADLAEQFQPTRQALNDLSERLLMLDDPWNGNEPGWGRSKN